MPTRPLEQVSHQAKQHPLLIATSHLDQRAFLAVQLDADGHTVCEADAAATPSRGCPGRGVDVLVLGELEHSRTGRHRSERCVERLREIGRSG
jgi:hypothetical protein